jgi:hypothetical protein
MILERGAVRSDADATNDPSQVAAFACATRCWYLQKHSYHLRPLLFFLCSGATFAFPLSLHCRRSEERALRFSCSLLSLRVQSKSAALLWDLACMGWGAELSWGSERGLFDFELALWKLVGPGLLPFFFLRKAFYPFLTRSRWGRTAAWRAGGIYSRFSSSFVRSRVPDDDIVGRHLICSVSELP